MLRKTVLSLKSPTGAFIAPLRCANANFWEYVTFGSVQEKTMKTLAKKREGWTVPALLTRKNTRLFIMIKL